MDARKLVRLARNVLFTRVDAFRDLPKARARVEVRAVEDELWAEAQHPDGKPFSQDELARALADGGVPADQAPRWSRAIITGDADDGIELDPPDNCAHCGSDIRGRNVCDVCGQRRGTVPERDAHTEAARALVRRLIAAQRIELVAAHAESAVVEETAAILEQRAGEPPGVIADALLAAWVDRDDVAEVFADADELIAALAG